MYKIASEEMKYFAYGSNMLLPRLKKRVPSAKFVTVAKLIGYTFKIHKRSNKDGSGKCNALRTNNPNDEVYGVVFEIESSDKHLLDKYEGLGRGYNEERVQLISNGKQLQAFTYIAAADAIDDSLHPYTWYKDIVVGGAKQNSLPPEYISSLEELPAVNDPDRERDKFEREILSTLSEESDI